MRGKTVKRLRKKFIAMGFQDVPSIWKGFKRAFNQIHRPNRNKFLSSEVFHG